jgi:D-beta-D-heptose 7-phosphate kinase/D-beta-D-heptose 1-phosphate adenosyltransferase
MKSWCRVGLTSGCFDLIHMGHLHYLDRCRRLCDKLIVGVDCDAMVRKAKGSFRPIINEFDRLALVSMLSCVDAAFMLRDLDDLHRIAIQFRVSFVFKHEGFAMLKKEEIVGVHGTGAELVLVPDEPGFVSTTDIINRVLAHRSSEAP